MYFYTNPQLGKTPKWIKKLEPRRWVSGGKKTPALAPQTQMRDEQPQATQTSIVPQSPAQVTYITPPSQSAPPPMPFIGAGQVQPSDGLLRTQTADSTRQRIAPAEFGPYIQAAYSDEPAQIVPPEFSVRQDATPKPAINWALILGIASLLILGN